MNLMPGAARQAMLVMAAASALVAARGRAQSVPDPTIVAGYINYTALLLGVTYTPTQRAELQSQVARYWARHATANMETVTRGAGSWQRMTARQDDIAAAAAAVARPDVLKALHQAADGGDADSRWLLDVYYAENPPIAPAAADGLPLVRAVVDARIDLDAFMQQEVRRTAAAPVDTRGRAAAYRLAAARYATMTGAQQLALARTPGELALTLGKWSRMSPVMQTMVRQSLGATISPAEHAAMQQALGQGPDGAQAQLLGNALRNMRQNSESIMGRGTVWNPAAGRWEQQGGIVTEFNGTVRVP
jgi:hypothetical protein